MTLRANNEGKQMGTRSIIAAKFDHNVTGQTVNAQDIVSTYCHYDGYLAHNGRLLVTYYNDDNSAFALADSGYLSSISDDVDKTLYGDIHANNGSPNYHWDEDELVQMAKDSWAEYVYLWDDGQWYYWDINKGTSKQELSKELVYKILQDGLASATSGDVMDWYTDQIDALGYVH